MKFIVRLIIFLSISSGRAQVLLPDAHYTTHNGLPQIQVTDMLQDKNGYIWVSTKKGVAKFNGEAFESVELPGLKFSHIHNIEMDDNGKLYFFSAETIASMLIYDGHSFTKRELPNIPKAYSYFKKIVDNKLYYIDKEKNVRSVDLYSEFEETTQPLPEKISLLVKTQSNLWGVTEDRKQIIDVQSNRIVKEVDEGKFGLHLTYKNDERVKVINDSLHYRTISILSSDLSREEIVIKINLLNGQNNSTVEISNNESTSAIVHKSELRLISDDKIISSFRIRNFTRVIYLEDMDGNHWVSHENGIEFYSKTKIETYPLELVKDAWAIGKSKEKFITASYSDGLHELDLKKQSSKKLYLPKEDKLNYSVVYNNKGSIYFAGSAHVWEYNGKKFKGYPCGTYNQNLINYYDSREEKLLVGGYKQLGVLGDEDSEITYFEDTTDTIITRFVVAIQKKDEKNYWVGTYNDLATFDLNSKQYTSYNHLFPNGTQGAICVEPTADGNLWIGNINGLWYYNSEEKSIETVAAELLGNEYVLALKILPNDIMAIGTSNGFSILDLELYNKEKEVRIKEFNSKNGFKGEEVAQNGFALVGDTLFVPSATYLSSIDIDELNFASDHSNLMVTKLNDIPVAWTSNEEVNLVKGEGNVTIEFEGVGFNRPHKNRYSYKLEEVDEEWSSWETNSTATYNNLSSGSYSFKVRKQNAIHSKDSAYPEVNIDFKVDLAFHKEPYFYKLAFATLLLMTLLASYFYLRNRNSRIISETQEQRIKYLEVQALQSQLNPHFIFNVLGTIQSLVLNKQTEEANKYLISFSKLIRGFLDSSVSSNLSSEKDAVDNVISLEEEIELLQLYVQFELLQYGHKFDLSLDDGGVDAVNTYIPPMIIQPYVENAIKHGLMHKESKGHLNITFSESDHHIVCRIEDDGIGRDKAWKMQAKSLQLYKSRGTELVQERISILNTLGHDLTIETIDHSPPKTGTVVVIKIAKQT